MSWTKGQAALVSYLLGRAGVDRTLKETPEEAGEGLAELAESLLREMQGGVANKLLGGRTTPGEPIQ